jgi:hypothetical protein
VRSVGLAAARVGLAAVVRLRAASAQFTSFCLCHSGASVPMKLRYRRVRLWHPEWVLDDVVVAHSHRERRLGLNLPGTRALLLYAASVHTFTMRVPIRVTPVGDSGRVGRSSLVLPRRIRSFPGRTWILESFDDTDRPPQGAVVQVLPSGFDVRDTHTLRNADREPI